MTAPATPWKAKDVRRLLKLAKAEGMPVERMGLQIEGSRITLLPARPEESHVSTGSGEDWDKRLA